MKRNSTVATSDLLTIGLTDPADVGQILRRMHREQPKALLVWIDSSEQDVRAELIAELRRRRPRLPLIALTREHDARVEQVARIAGAAFYFPMTCAADQRLLDQTLASLGIEPPIPREHSGLPPPAIRGSPRLVRNE
ncbi:MAG: hypothetical protein H7Z14_19415 [Anaerolineae bacterium]|nr:hypothetical protein [Phycisphaerae bacterium]